MGILNKMRANGGVVEDNKIQHTLKIAIQDVFPDIATKMSAGLRKLRIDEIFQLICKDKLNHGKARRC